MPLLRTKINKPLKSSYFTKFVYNLYLNLNKSNDIGLYYECNWWLHIYSYIYKCYIDKWCYRYVNECF